MKKYGYEFIKEGKDILTLEDLSNVSSVVLYDYSNYDENLCNNGGRYAFWSTYTKIDDKNMFSRREETSADFTYCPNCGSFDDHYDDDIGGYTCGEELVSAEELLELVNFYMQDEELAVEINF